MSSMPWTSVSAPTTTITPTHATTTAARDRPPRAGDASKARLAPIAGDTGTPACVAALTTFEITDASITARDNEGLDLHVTVRNTGRRDGHHVIQVYGHRTTGTYAGERFLAGFTVAEVPVSCIAQVRMRVDLLPLADWDADTRQRVLPAVEDVILEVGSYAHDRAGLVLNLSEQ